MANGYASLHPVTEELLRLLGVTSAQVEQGWGYVEASAGYHAPVGIKAGRKFSHCFDLSWDCNRPELLQHLVGSGVIPFVRNWAGNRHLHCIHLGLTADDGQPHLLSGPRRQIKAFLENPPRDGLAGNGPLTGFVPSRAQQEELRGEYERWLPDFPTRVVAPGGQQIRCYAWLENDRVTCEVRPFMEWWGCTVSGDAQHVSAQLKGQTLNLSGAGLTFDGRFWRGQVRGLAQALGLTLRYEHYAAYGVVRLGYGATATATSTTTATAAGRLAGRLAGIDVYAGDGKINWQAAYADGQRLALIKATEGADFDDPRWSENVLGARAAGFPGIGSYHFFLPGGNGAAQAKHFLRKVGGAQGLRGQILPTIDAERRGSMTVDQYTASVQAWCDVLEATIGRKPMIYCNRDYAVNHLRHVFGAYPLWLAQWGDDEPTGPVGGWQAWTIWQNDAFATIPGLPNQGGVDTDVFRGTVEDLKQLVV
jgi:GH25 family lysozyme M1 (1,4-beta-N-acetylmuramidase)